MTETGHIYFHTAETATRIETSNELGKNNKIFWIESKNQ